jgi:phytoene dehydrogenase-like protein
MAKKTLDAIVIGAGHNGLVAAAYLAKAGKQVLVLERDDRVGGILRATEPAPGFTAPGLVHTTGRLRASVVKDLKLDRFGYRTVTPSVRMHAPMPDGSAVTFWADAGRTAEELRARSAEDAAAYPTFDKKVRAIASFLAYVAVATPPDPKSPSLADAIMGLRLGKAFRDLGGKTGREAIRALPMAVADLVQEVFSSEAVRGPLATRGVLYTAMGAWATGTAAVFMSDSAGTDGGAAGTAVLPVGGTGALVDALAQAAASLGVQVRTGIEVVEIRNQGTRAIGVTLADGTELNAPLIVSAADPKRTAALCDPVTLGPTMVWRTGNIRQPGATARVNLALSGLPAFHGGDPERLSGRIVLGPSIDDVERAMDAVKYGHVSEEPVLDATIPSLTDPTLAPEGKHVMSVVFQAAPYALRDGDWATERDRVGDITIKALESVAPGFGELVEAREVITPADMEANYGLSGGHIQHAEPALDQFFAWRPLLGEARYAFLLEGLYLAGSGAHPGGGITGGPGANAARQILKDLKK